MALGGAFSRGMQTGSQTVARAQQTGLARRQMDLAENQDQRAKRARRLEEFQATLKDSLKTASSIMQNAQTKKAAGEEVDMSKVGEAIDHLKTSNMMTARMLETSGIPVNSKIVEQQFETVKTVPSVQQEQKVAAQGEGQVAAQKAEQTGETESWVHPETGETREIRITDSDSVDRAIAEGFMQRDISVVADDPSKLQKERGAADEALGDVRSGADVIKELRDVPGAVGLPGTITEKVGGFLGGLGMKSAEKLVSNIFSGADPEEVKAARSKFVTFQGSMAKSILQDSRISDYERRILNEALGATSMNASDTALIGAYKKTLASATTLARRKKKLAGEDVLDLDDDEGINRLGQQLVAAGLTNEDAVDVIREIKSIESINDL